MTTSEFFEALSFDGPVLTLDIGSGTQDALLAVPDMAPENWPRVVLPSPALQRVDEIRELTAKGQPVWLHGVNMGGGFHVAVKEHLDKELPLAATLEAAKAIHRDVESIKALGITIAEECPEGYQPVELADFFPDFWRNLLEACRLPQPRLIMAAAQDHGSEADIDQCKGRFCQWKRLIDENDGDPSGWIYTSAPEGLDRLAALQRSTGGPVADTSTAAVLAALSIPEVAERSDREGICVVNLGNSHTTAFLVYRRCVYGIYEHHTGYLTTDKLIKDLNEFRLGWLPDEQVRAAGGHGCVFMELPPEAEGFRPTFVLGPKRRILKDYGKFIAPCGEMMLAGCYGLLYGLARRRPI